MELLIKIMLDLSLVTTILILSYLSRKMGDALKIRPYYIILIIAAIVIVVAGGIDVGMRAYSGASPPVASLAMRGCAGVAALGVCLRYWSWLFSEFFGG